MSNRWVGVAALAASMSALWIGFMLHGSPWIGLTWVGSITFVAVLWASTRETRSAPAIGQMIAALESEPVPAVAVGAATPAPKAVL